MNEYAVSTLAKQNNLQHVIPLESFHLAPNHVGFLFPKYELDFRTFLENKRDARHIQSILLQLGKGILELHKLGYIHRDLKPDNIVLNLKPLKAVIIDFDRVKLDST